MPDEPNTPPPLNEDGDEKKGATNDVADALNEAADQVKNAASEIGDKMKSPPPPVDGIGLGQGKLAQSDERTIGMLSHLLGAFTLFVGPLVLWLMKREESPFINDQAKEALNFQILITIVVTICWIISNVIPFAVCVLLPLIGCVVVVNLIMAIVGALAANKGIVYRYPFNLRLIS